jgi:hypothetical protein
MIDMELTIWRWPKPGASGAPGTPPPPWPTASHGQDARRKLSIGYGPQPCPHWAKKEPSQLPGAAMAALIRRVKLVFLFSLDFL